MKKLISLLVIFSIIFSMGMITVNAAASCTYDTMATLQESGLPLNWTNSGQTDNRELIQSQLTADDKVLSVTKMNRSGGANFNISNKLNNSNLLLTGSERKIHITTMISAQEKNFSKVGITFNKATLNLDGTTATSQSTLSNSELLVFEKQEDGTIDLKSWGQTIQEDFPFETNKLYKLDCIIHGQTNTMNLYIDNVQYGGTIDYSPVVQAAAGGASKYYINTLHHILLLFNTSTEQDRFLIDNTGCIVYRSSFTEPTFTAPKASKLTIDEDDNYIAKDKNITLSTDASITVATLLGNISGNSSSELVVIGSDGLYKTGTENVTKGDKVVEVIPVTATTDTDAKKVFIDEKVTLTQFNIDSSKYNTTGHVTGSKSTITNCELTDEQTIKNASGKTMAFWDLTSDNKNYRFEKVQGIYGKNVSDDALKVGIQDAKLATKLIFSTDEVKTQTAGEVIHVTAELAAETEKFNNLGIATQFNGSKRTEVFGFGKDENNNVVLKAFGEKISGTDDFIFKTNQFYKIDLLFECGTSKVKIYLDGKYLGEKDYAVNVFGAATNITSLKYFYISCGYSQFDYFYCDNMHVMWYEQGKPAFVRRAAEATLSDDYATKTNNGAVYLASHGATVEEVLGNFNTTKTLAVFDRDYNVLESTDCITNGAKIVETAKDGETLHYTEIRMPYDCITLTQTSKEEDGVTTYTVNASSLFANSGEKAEYMLLIAQYGENSLENAELVHIDLTEGYGEEYIKEVNLKSTTDPAGKIKAFIWSEDGLDSLEIKVQ